MVSTSSRLVALASRHPAWPVVGLQKQACLSATGQCQNVAAQITGQMCATSFKQQRPCRNLHNDSVIDTTYTRGSATLPTRSLLPLSSRINVCRRQ